VAREKGVRRMEKVKMESSKNFMEKVKIVRNVCLPDIFGCQSYEKGICTSKNKCCMRGIGLELKRKMTQVKEKEYKIVVEKMLWKGKAEYIYGKLVTRPGISFNICLSAGNSWGWTYNIATEEEAQEVIRRKQVAHINSGF